MVLAVQYIFQVPKCLCFLCASHTFPLVKRILAQHPLDQPHSFQHQPRWQQLPADLHRRERGGDDQFFHPAQRTV